MASKHLSSLESRNRDTDLEIISDEEFLPKKEKVNSWYFGMSNSEKLKDGPNINLKYFKKTYETKEEKNFITKISGRNNRNKLCKTFQERGFCLFGKRCNYRHIFKEKLLFTYESILQRTSQEIMNEINKKGNKECSIMKIYKLILLKRKIIM